MQRNTRENIAPWPRRERVPAVAALRKSGLRVAAAVLGGVLGAPTGAIAQALPGVTDAPVPDAAEMRQIRREADFRYHPRAFVEAGVGASLLSQRIKSATWRLAIDQAFVGVVGAGVRWAVVPMVDLQLRASFAFGMSGYFTPQPSGACPTYGYSGHGGTGSVFHFAVEPGARFRPGGPFYVGGSALVGVLVPSVDPYTYTCDSSSVERTIAPPAAIPVLGGSGELGAMLGENEHVDLGLRVTGYSAVGADGGGGHVFVQMVLGVVFP